MKKISYLFSKKLWLTIYDDFLIDENFSKAAHVAYYYLFAMFPFLLIIIALFGLSSGVLKNNDVVIINLFDQLVHLLPHDIFELLKTELAFAKQNAISTISIAFLLALYTTTSATRSLMLAIQRSYNIKEKELSNPAKQIGSEYVKAFFVNIISIIVFSLSITALGLSHKIILFSSHFIGWDQITIQFISFIRWPLIFILLSFFIAFIYHLSIEQSKTYLRQIPGACLSTLFWMVGVLGLKAYFSYSGDYSLSYGSIGALLALQLFLYISSLIILLGAFVNGLMNKKSFFSFFEK